MNWIGVIKINNPSMQGALIGAILTAVVYLLLSNSVTLWGKERSTGDEKNRHYDNIVFGGSPDIILDEVHTSNSVGSVVFHGRKATVLSITPVPINQIDSTTQLIKDTWGQGTERWRVAMGTKGAGKVKDKDPNNVFEAKECEDFTTELEEDYLSTEKLFCLLKAIHDKYLYDHKWFLIATNSMYISMAGLERFLMGKDPDESVYIGKSEGDSHYCSGVAGLLISQSALERIVAQLESCLHIYADLNESVSGDVMLGTCFSNKLYQSCYSFGKFSREVDVTVSPNSPEFESYYGGHFVIYPADQTLMRELHLLHLKIEMAYHHSKAQEYRDSLFLGPICNPPHLDIEVPLPLNNSSSENKVWSVINPNVTYQSGSLEPQWWFDADVRMELESLMKQGVQLRGTTDSYYPQSAKLTYGLFRYNGLEGREVILDVETKNKTHKKNERIHMVRPHDLKPVLLEDAGPEAMNKTIDFVVPLSNVKSRFTEFMKIYESFCLRDDEKCRLNLVVYGSSDIEAIRSDLTVYKKKYPSAQFVVIPGTGKFSRGRALHQGISSLQKSDLAFACDVDISIEKDFLDRCRRNAIQGRRVYYPQVFKYYNMDYVYKFKKRPMYGYEISRYHGHWCTYGYGMLCMYKSDYDYVGGYDSKIEGWGGEDIVLTDRVIQKGLEIMRAPDPSLLHRFHPKICSTSLSKQQYSQCLSSRNEDIADSRRLVDYKNYLETKCQGKTK